MQFSQLRYLIEVAKEHTISAAARNLFIAQPSLSQQIAKLENELGISLLVRHHRSVTLTDAGKVFVQQAARITSEVDQLSELMKRYSSMQEGTLHIGLLWIAGYTNLIGKLSAFHQQFPGLTYRFTIDSSKSLLEKLKNRSLQAIFIISSHQQLIQQKSLHFSKMQDDYYVSVVSANHELAKKSCLSIEDFQGQNVIMPAPNSTFREQLDYEFKQKAILPNVLCETSQSDLIIQLVSNNCGIGFSSNSIASSLKTNCFKIIPLDFTVKRSIYYVTLKELLEYPTVKEMTSYMEKTERS